MSKNHRGSGIRTLPAHGRGTCAICGKDAVKVLWEKEINGETVKICKICNAVLKNKARTEARAAKSAAAEASAPAESAEALAEEPAAETAAE